jgi:hypothetical protein
MGFRAVEVGLGELIHEAADERLVGNPRQTAVEAEQRGVDPLALGGQRLRQLRLQLVDARRAGHGTGGELLGALGARIELQPQPRSLGDQVGLTREHGQLGGAPGDAGITGAPGQIEVGLGCQRNLAAGTGDLGKHQLVDDLRRQLLDRIGGLSRAAAAASGAGSAWAWAGPWSPAARNSDANRRAGRMRRKSGFMEMGSDKAIGSRGTPTPARSATPAGAPRWITPLQ